MCGVGQEVLLRGDRLIQPREQVVDCAHQRRHLFGHIALVDRAQIVTVTPADALLQFVERTDAARKRQPQQQHAERHKDQLRQHHPLQDLGGQHRSLAQRLGHLDHRRGAPGQPGHIGPQIGHAHADAAHHVVAKAHLARLGALCLDRPVQRALATQVLALRPHDPVRQAGRVCCAQALERVGLQLEWRRRQASGPLFCDLSCQRSRHVCQGAVVGGVGDALCGQPGHADVHQPQ